MKKLILLILLLPLFALAQENDSFLLTMSEITVKPGHDAQFVEGVKAWKSCYLDNKGDNKWNMWKRIQGEGSVYVLTGRMANWAEMDESGDEAGKNCQMTVVNFIMPHVESVHFNVARYMPTMSKASALNAETELVWVNNFKISNSSDFRSTIEEVSATMKKAEGDHRGWWYAVIGGAPEVADYFISVPYKNFAALDVDSDSPWKIYEKEHGKEKTEAMRAKFRASLSESWSYIYKLQKKLSN